MSLAKAIALELELVQTKHRQETTHPTTESLGAPEQMANVPKD
jgi:hypothetical protein